MAILHTASHHDHVRRCSSSRFDGRSPGKLGDLRRATPHLSRTLLCALLFALIGLSAGRPQDARACGAQSGDPSTRAGQSIEWARSLVLWHATRRVSSADPEDVGIRALQAAAERELSRAREHYDSGRYDEAVYHADTVAALLDN